MGKWGTLLFGICIGIISLGKKSQSKFNIGLFLLLVILFFFAECLVIEFNYAYYFGMLPYFCIVSAHGYVALFEKIKNIVFVLTRKT
jgi:hypothetical protein